MRRWVIALSCLSLLVAAPAVPAQATTSAHTLIQGSGSSWASNAVQQWIADVRSEGLQVSYAADGSAAGRQDFANDIDDFAVTDLPYQGTDPATGQSDTSNGRDLAYVPLVAGGTSFPYHLDVKGKPLENLRLSGASIAGIFTGRIRYWNDPSIENDNRHRIALPHLRIVPVVHSEGSAASYQLASYLSTEYPSDWQAFTSPTTEPSEYWPATPGAQPEAGSDAVVNYIDSSSANGSIGYDEYTFALGRALPVVALQNPAGYFVLPNADDVALALEQATTNPDGTADLTGVYEARDRRAYPLSSYSYALVPTAQDDPKMTTAKRQTIVDFLDYSLCQGQAEMSRVGYAPLPLDLVEDSFDGVRKLAAADPNVDADAASAETCHNPTFVDGPPPRDVLGRDTPNPPACASAAHGPCGLPADRTALTAPRSTRVRAHARHTLPTRLRDLVTRRAVSGAPVALWQRSGTSTTWHRVTHGRTRADGTWTAAVRPSRTTRYQFRYSGDLDRRATRSSVTVLRTA